MPSKHPSQPPASSDDKVDEAPKGPTSPEKPALGEPVLDEDEKPTEPMRRRSPKHLRALVPGAKAAAKADNNGK
jgi:hypothetical protein